MLPIGKKSAQLVHFVFYSALCILHWPQFAELEPTISVVYLSPFPYAFLEAHVNGMSFVHLHVDLQRIPSWTGIETELDCCVRNSMEILMLNVNCLWVIVVAEIRVDFKRPRLLLRNPVQSLGSKTIELQNPFQSHIQLKHPPQPQSEHCIIEIWKFRWRLIGGWPRSIDSTAIKRSNVRWQRSNKFN